jgi:hypothetical protein
MPESQTQMSNLRDRLKPPVPATMPGLGEREAAPSPMLEPSHAATKHNGQRREVEMVKIHYGTESSIALPYAYLATIDMPKPGMIVLEFASRTVIIEGIRLEGLMSELMNRHVAMVRANDNPAFDAGGKEPFIQRVTVKKPDEQA